MTTRRDFLKKAGMGLAAVTLGTMALGQKDTQKCPNFIFYITDDISPDDLGCYGSTIARTPHIDKMAAEGLVFDNAYLTISSCSPSRCSFITGRYPHNHGAPELHTQLPTDQHIYPHALRQAGYYTVLAGKNHIGDVERGFDLIAPPKGPGFQENWVEIMQQRPKDKPFFFWFASYDAHRGWQINDKAPEYDPDSIQPPPYLYDGPETRQDLTGYFHEVSRTDFYLGELMKELQRQGVADNTYIVYCSDNGRPFPRCKTWLYDSGIKTPLIIWKPDTIKPGRTDSLVSAIDVAPTILELAGVEKDPRIQGVSFTAILRDPKAIVRDYAFAEHNWHVFAAYERMLRYKNWLYIRNAWPDRLLRSMETIDAFPAGIELYQQQELGHLHPHQQDVFKKPRPAESLFDVQADPNQFTNLAESPSAYHQKVLSQLREVMDHWIEQTGDSVPETPTTDTFPEDAVGDPLKLSQEYRNLVRRGPFPGADHDAAHIRHPGPVRCE